MDRNSLFTEALMPAKMVIASIATLGAVLADAVAELPKAEDYTVKGVLALAVVYLVRQLTQERKEHKEEAQKREDKMSAALDATAQALEALKASTDTQTGYFKTIAQTIINRSIGKPPLPPEEGT